MKTLFLLVFATMLSAHALACPGFGKITMKYKGKQVAEINEIDGTLYLREGYSLEFLNSKTSNESEGVDALDVPGGWKWICDERGGIDNAYRSQRAYCHDLKKDQLGAYILFPEYKGVRDFHVSLTKTDDDSAFIVFRVNGANIDPEQPIARSPGCGKTVSVD